ncbi:hypothetical protein PILCRDRAFT_821814 [Piloderma croceum F 1598]|uniref:Uncharacterized protein n=1 Tax=Piloderma croceum (strain F 1598) TaxID=765440 RepID=A0A0C3FMF8_PILCF|nr:hypothetical protein PILCRDRAFT_821814 [Piloderma croceum F 1598]
MTSPLTYHSRVVAAGTEALSVFEEAMRPFSAAITVAVAFESVESSALMAMARFGDRFGGDRGNQSKEYSGNEETHCLIKVRFECEVECYGGWR